MKLKSAARDAEPLVNGVYRLRKFPGKGGWTYAEVPEIAPDKKAPFNWVTVRGSIDAYTFEQYKLMPMGNGHLFLPVKAAVRKLIGKKEGDTVHVVLYRDDSGVRVPQEVLDCLADEPAILRRFESLDDSVKTRYIKWVQSARTEDAKAERIAAMMDELAAGKPRTTEKKKEDHY